MLPHSLKLSLLLLAVYVFSPTFSQRDYTYTDLANGQDVTETVVRRISNSEIFPDDHSFLARLSYVESRYGTQNDTFRANYTGGIWQVDEAYYTRTLNSALAWYHTGILEKFGVNWLDSTTWKSCLAPMYSGLAAALYFAQLPELIPEKLSDQAAFWKRYYRPAGDVADFVNAANEMRDNAICRGKMDLVIALDGSGSVGPVDFQRAKDFVAQMIESFTLDFSRMGLLVYSTSVATIFDLKENLTISQMAQRARNAAYPSGNTNTDLAILRATAMLNEAARVDGVPRIVSLLTDGMNNGANLPGAVEEMTRNQLLPISLGIGPAVNYEELKFIALNNTKLVFTVPDFEALQDFLYKLKTTICEIPQNPAINGSYQDSLVTNEKRIYKTQIPAKGATVILTNSVGNIAAYWSRTEQVPNSAVHDGIIDGVTYFPAEEDDVPIYITVQGAEQRNDYLIDVIEGKVGVTEPPTGATPEDTTEPGMPGTTPNPECPTPEPEPCNCCDRCPLREPREVHHHHYYYSDPSAKKGDEQYSYPHELII